VVIEPERVWGTQALWVAVPWRLGHPPAPQVHIWPHPCMSRAGALVVRGAGEEAGELRTAPDELDFSQAITATPHRVTFKSSLFIVLKRNKSSCKQA